MKILLILSLFILPYQTQAFSLFRHYPEPTKDDYLSQQLNLNKDQQLKIKEIKQRYKIDQRKVNLLNALKDFESKTKDSSITSEDLKKHYQELKEKRQHFSDEHFNQMIEIRQILTKEQISMFSKLKKPKKFFKVN